MIQRQVEKQRRPMPGWTSTRYKGNGREIRMVLYVDLIQHPNNWRELSVTTLSIDGINTIQLEDNDFNKVWQKL